MIVLAYYSGVNYLLELYFWLILGALALISITIFFGRPKESQYHKDIEMEILEGNIEVAGKEHQRLLEFFNIIFVVTNPIPIRYYVKKAGYDIGSPRLPMTEPDDQTKAILDESLKKYNIDLK